MAAAALPEEESPKQPEKEMWRVASPAYDYAFEQLFYHEQHKELVINFLNCLFCADAGEDGEMVTDIEFDSVRTEGDSKLICSVRGKKYKYKFDLEMKRYATQWFFKRSMYCGSEYFITGNPRSTDYKLVPPVKIVSIIRDLDSASALEKPDGMPLKRSKMTSRWESIVGEEKTDWKESDTETVELIELHLSSTNLSYAHGTSLQQWLAFFNIEAIFKVVEQYVVELDPDSFSDENVKKALVVMKKIIEEDFVNYKGSAEKEMIKELELREAARETEEANKRAENERKEKEEANKRAENERKEKEEAMRREEEAKKREEEAKRREEKERKEKEKGKEKKGRSNEKRERSGK